MTTIAVIGATGIAGSRVVARLKSRDVAIVEISREHGVDLFDGPELSHALQGVDVVIDVSNPVPPDGRSDITQTLAAASRNIVGASARQDVQRLVVSTIAGIEDPVFDGFPYYEAKRAAKDILLEGPVPTTIVKSTQWYESATNHDAVTCNAKEVIVEDWLIQPIAADTVADVLVEAALGQSHTPRTITGPDAIRLPDLTSKLLAQQGDRRRVRTVEPAVAALGAGALLAPGHAVVVGPDVETWLQTMAPPSTDGHHAADGDGRPGSR
ncbi:LysR family transcriptional regulator [Mycobacterium mantenii]|uniref:LysR family transcriptional regulator n=1 Tax=Mycobacterium mantenii TaxID=560555 RepID=A0A1X0G507_MYCNT|nr:NAD(P)H-binding protein [Mycobacterium mantenii]MCV7243613.1 NAD(P)H-binding protein [Mycobacterium mantenii]ORB08915.1 NmrA family protein [Mycobacterium mantenii]BBY41447.1 LysR family transcriptional regulator [Mycobacterium mantenii]